MLAHKHKPYERMTHVFQAFLLLVIQDHVFWKEFNKKTWEKARRFFSSHKIKQEDQEDLFQETQITFLNNLEKGKIRYQGFPSTYFAGIARIKLFEHLRKVKGKTLISLEDADLQHEINQFDTFQLSSEHRSCFQKAMDQLSDRDKTIIVMRLGYGYRHDDIAEDIGAASAQAVRVSFFRARQKLTDQLNACKSTQNNNMS